MWPPALNLSHKSESFIKSNNKNINVHSQENEAEVYGLFPKNLTLVISVSDQKFDTLFMTKMAKMSE